MSKDFAQKLRATGVNLFTDKSYNAKRNAQLNLDSRTHYADDSTLRYFHARILSASDCCDGLVFYVIESVALDCDNRARGFRFVLFDVYGNTIERPALADSFKTADKARTAMLIAIRALDPVAYTKGKIAQHCSREQQTINALLEVIA